MHAAKTPIGFHVMLRLVDDRPIVTSVAELRALARVVLEQGERRGLLAFGAADNHVHAELAADRATSGAFAHYVATSLRWRLALGVSFEPARIRPLVDQRHAYNTFLYVQRQDTRHDLGRDPWREATSLPDLLGMRVRPTSIVRRVRAQLPRVRRDALLALLPSEVGEGLATEGPVPMAVLADAACAAFALPDLQRRRVEVTAAQRAAVHAAGASAPSRDLADHLGVDVRSVQRFRTEPVDESAVRAVTLQASMRSATRKLTIAAIPPPAVAGSACSRRSGREPAPAVTSSRALAGA